MIEETIGRRGSIHVRRLVLEPGEATAWHVDPYLRLSVVVRGDALAIEYRDGGQAERIAVNAGEADWDEPTGRVHRAVNVGRRTYEEVTTFFLDRPDAVPQPRADDEAEAR
jgi:quercetin dioxygenase-like cupin family protein